MKMLVDFDCSERLVTGSVMFSLSFPQSSKTFGAANNLFGSDPMIFARTKLSLMPIIFQPFIPSDSSSFVWARTLSWGHLRFSGFSQVKVLFL